MRTEDGTYLFLTGIRRNEFHRDPETATFLEFLSRVAESDTTTGQRSDWLEWWKSYVDSELPLELPSSETVDELGRILEEARREGAFREPA